MQIPSNFTQPENYVSWVQNNLMKWVIYGGFVLSFILFISALFTPTTYFIGATLVFILISICNLLLIFHKNNYASNLFLYGVLFVNLLQGYIQQSAYALCILSFILILTSIIKPTSHLIIIGFIILIFISLYHYIGVIQWQIIKDPDTGLVYVNNTSVLVPFLVLSFISALIISKFIIKTINEQKEHIREISIAKDELSKSILEIHRQNEIKSSLLANFSHELRTPLNSIIGFSEIIQDNQNHLSESEIRDFIIDINKSGHNLLDLVQNVLNVTKFEKNDEKVQFSLIKINELADSIKLKINQDLLKKNGSDSIKIF